jgi:hypothetical protein
MFIHTTIARLTIAWRMLCQSFCEFHDSLNSIWNVLTAGKVHHNAYVTRNIEL